MISDILGGLDVGANLWIGGSAPRHDMADGSAAYEPRQDFRLHPSQHQAFDLVFLVERDLARLKQWPLILDEALRAVAPGGLIVIRASQSPLMSNFQLAHFVSRWTGDRFQLVNVADDAVTRILTIRLTHERRRPADDKAFSFGLVTDGRKPANVAAFVDSILAMEGATENIEILLSGPRSLLTDLGSKATAVTLVEQPEQFLEKGWITRKKNQLVAAASQPNIVIVHDRYVLPKTFLGEVSAFGGDFSVLAPRQTTFKGAPLPDWSMVADDLNWSTPGWMEHGDYHPWGFITGGVMIAKTEILRSTPWNELLFWGQAEDVELTRRLSAVGVVQRLARNVRVLSEEPRPGFVEGFERLPWRDDIYSQTKRASFDGASPTGPLGTATYAVPEVMPSRTFDLTGARSVETAAAAGLIMSRDWMETSHGAVWREPGPAVISFKMTPPFAKGILLEFSSEADAKFMDMAQANSESCQTTQISAKQVYVSLPAAALAASNIVHLTLRCSDPGQLALRSIAFAAVPPILPYVTGETLNFGEPLSGAYLGTGWHSQESWGVWAKQAVAILTLPIAIRRREALQGEASIQAFCPSGTKDQVIALRINGVRLGEWRFSASAPAMDIQFEIPERVVTDIMRLEFRASRIDSPRHAGAGDDERPLGVGLRTLRLSAVSR